MYKIYEVDVCFTSYAMDTCLIGASDIEDLVAHLKEIFEDRLENTEIEELIASAKEESVFQRIKEVKSLFTDEPYKILEWFSYYE